MTSHLTKKPLSFSVHYRCRALGVYGGCGGHDRDRFLVLPTDGAVGAQVEQAMKDVANADAVAFSQEVRYRTEDYMMMTFSLTRRLQHIPPTATASPRGRLEDVSHSAVPIRTPWKYHRSLTAFIFIPPRVFTSPSPHPPSPLHIQCSWITCYASDSVGGAAVKRLRAPPAEVRSQTH